jgi:outer membrane protein OmpA-like peptidoglycan-associated protein
MGVTGERLIYYVGRLLSMTETAQAEHGTEYAEEEAVHKEDEAEARRKGLVAEITAMIEEYEVADTTVEIADDEVRITLSNIQFVADSAVLLDAERTKIQEIANILRNIPGIRLLVAGHTALAGTGESRLGMSLARAQAIADYLVLLGACEAENITAVGYGADRPIASNLTQEDMALNRRVEITILE